MVSEGWGGKANHVIRNTELESWQAQDHSVGD